MVTTIKKRKSVGSKKRFIGRPNGQIQERVQSVGPEHFGIVSVDCAKRRSKWMLCNFYGKVIIEPTTVEHTAGGLRLMTQLAAQACQAEGLSDTVVAVEMTGIYHKPAQRAFRKAGFDTRIVHPFASNHYRRPLHPDEKTDDHDLEAIFQAAVNGYGLATLPVSDIYQSLQAVSRHRHNLVKQRSRLMVQMRRLLHQTMPGFADLFDDEKLFHKSIAMPMALTFSSPAAIRMRRSGRHRGPLDQGEGALSNAHDRTYRRLGRRRSRAVGTRGDVHATVATVERGPPVARATNCGCGAGNGRFSRENTLYSAPQRDGPQRRLVRAAGRGSRADRALRLGSRHQRTSRSVPVAVPKRSGRSPRRLARSPVQSSAPRSRHARGGEPDQVPSVLSWLVGTVGSAERRSARSSLPHCQPRCGWSINWSAGGKSGVAEASTVNTCWPSCKSSIAFTTRRSTERFAT